jgi:hypothetical protein
VIQYEILGRVPKRRFESKGQPSSEHGKNQAVKARSWPWLAGEFLGTFEVAASLLDVSGVGCRVEVVGM